MHLAWVGFKHTTLVVIGTDCIGSCKFNCHTITTTTAPFLQLILYTNVLQCCISFKHYNIFFTFIYGDYCTFISNNTYLPVLSKKSSSKFLRSLLSRFFSDFECISSSCNCDLKKNIVFSFIVFNTTFNNMSVISWWLVLLVEETGGFVYVSENIWSLKGLT
jgi:hypothetical protein